MRYVLSKALGLGRIVRDRLLLLPFFAASLVVPRSGRLWAFGSWHGSRFADNPKHFFLYCQSLRESPVRAVWLSADRGVVRALRAMGLPAHHRSSLAGLWCALRAGVYLLDCRVNDVHGLAWRGAVKVNLWHGVPLKKIERDIEQADHTVSRAYRGPLFDRLLLKLRRPELTERYDMILATSETTAERFSSAFGVGRDAVIRAGYPRTDPLLADHGDSPFLVPEERAVVEELAAHRREGRRVLFYMPTFRDWSNTADRVIPIDWARLDRTLDARGGVLYCKLHPGDRANLPDVGALRRIRLLPSGMDPYPLLRHTDALISDYSSIFFDYLMLDRPILFYPYDLADYERYSRSLYDDYATVTPGPKAHDAASLDAMVAELLARYDAEAERFRGERERVRARFFEHVDDRASARLFETLLTRVAA